MVKCRGLCKHENVPYRHSNYLLSSKCMYCEQWFSPGRTYCPCCEMRLREKPRFKKIGRQRDMYQRKLPPKTPWLVSKY